MRVSEGKNREPFTIEILELYNLIVRILNHSNSQDQESDLRIDVSGYTVRRIHDSVLGPHGLFTNNFDNIIDCLVIKLATTAS